MKKIYIFLITVFLSYPFFVVSVSANINDFVVPQEVNYFESVGSVDAATFDDFNFSNALFGRNGFNVKNFEITIKMNASSSIANDEELCNHGVYMFDKAQNLVIERNQFGADYCNYTYVFSGSESRQIYSAIFSQKFEQLVLYPSYNVDYFPLNYLALLVRGESDTYLNFEFRINLYNAVKIDVKSAYIDFVIGRTWFNDAAPEYVMGRASLILGSNGVYDYYDFYNKLVTKNQNFLNGDYENMRLVGNTGAVIRSVDEISISWKGRLENDLPDGGFTDYFFGLGQLNVFSDTMVIKAPITDIEVPGFENTECNAWDFPCHISNAFNSIIDRVIKSLNAVTSSITSGVTSVMASAFGVFAVFDNTPLAGFIEFMAVMFGIFIIIIFWKRK